MRRNPTVALAFLQWFRLFFDENHNGREYHAFEARGGQRIIPADLGGSSVQLWINHNALTQIYYITNV